MHQIHRVFTLAMAISLMAGCEWVRTPEACEADSEAMQTAITEILVGGQSCIMDEDCVSFDVSNGCFGACSLAVNRGETQRLEDEIWDADMAYCTGFVEQCGYLTPGCPAMRPACEQGQCRMVEAS